MAPKPCPHAITTKEHKDAGHYPIFLWILLIFSETLPRLYRASNVLKNTNIPSWARFSGLHRLALSKNAKTKPSS